MDICVPGLDCDSFRVAGLVPMVPLGLDSQLPSWWFGLVVSLPIWFQSTWTSLDRSCWTLLYRLIVTHVNPRQEPDKLWNRLGSTLASFLIVTHPWSQLNLGGFPDLPSNRTAHVRFPFLSYVGPALNTTPPEPQSNPG